MTTTVDAVYEGGVFRPTRLVALTEGTHVEVVIPTAVPPCEPKAVAERLARIAGKACQTGQSESTSSNHDQFLYGENSHK
ncbi:MAG: antitoxin family protein [Pirellulaceae bacterium]|nr:antitoxin family protein [Pirellulaceae bacterium]